MEILKSDFLDKYNGIYIDHRQPQKGAVYSNEFITLIYAPYSQSSFKINGNTVSVCEGDIILLDKCIPHSFEDRHSNMSFYICFFTPDILFGCYERLMDRYSSLSEELASKGYVIVHDDTGHTIQKYFIRMIDDINYQYDCFEDSFKCNIILALTDIMRIHTSGAVNNGVLCSNSYVFSAISYIRKNIYRKIKLSDISEELNITREHLCRIFKEQTGMTVIDYINMLRVNRIKHILENTDKPLYLLFQDFSLDENYLNSLFKKRTGYSIKKYRQKFNYKSISAEHGKE